MAPHTLSDNFKEVKSTPEAIEKLLREHSKDFDNGFFIAMSSHLSREIEHGNKPLVEQLSEINKNKFYYYFCYNVKDYVFQRKDPKTLQVLVLPKFICFKTYIPNARLYLDLLRVIDCKRRINSRHNS